MPWWQQVVSDVIGGAVILVLSHVPSWIRGAVRHEMAHFCADSCPFRAQRANLLARVLKLEAKD